jgi:hypothetical protein
MEKSLLTRCTYLLRHGQMCVEQYTKILDCRWWVDRSQTSNDKKKFRKQSTVNKWQSYIKKYIIVGLLNPLEITVTEIPFVSFKNLEVPGKFHPSPDNQFYYFNNVSVSYRFMAIWNFTNTITVEIITSRSETTTVLYINCDAWVPSV